MPLAEEGWIEDPITNLIVYRYLQPLLAKQIDTLILGCTHYPLLKNSIQRVCGLHITLVDSGMALAQEIGRAFDEKRITQNLKTEASQEQSKLEFLMTDFSQHSKEMAELILHPHSALHFEIVHL